MQRLTGYRATTCPTEALYRPEVARAAEWKASRYSALLEPDPPRALVQAVAAMRAGESALLESIRTAPPKAPGGELPDLPGPITSPDQFKPRKRRTA